MIRSMTVAVALMAASAVHADEPTNLGVAWIGESGIADSTAAGFAERMAEVAPEFAIEYQRALPDEAAFAKAIGDFDATKDGIVVIRSSGAEWLAQHGTTLPTFIGGVNHPTSIGVIADIDAPDGNITGTTYFLDYSTVLETFVAMAPDAMRYMILTQSGHPSSKVDAEGLSSACMEMLVECTFLEVSGVSGVTEAIGAASADAFIIGNQAELFDDKALFEQAIALAGTRPMFALSRSAVEQGATASMAASNHKLGRMLADQVVSVLRDGASIAATPVGRDREPVLIISKNAIERLGLKIPRQMLETADLLDG